MEKLTEKQLKYIGSFFGYDLDKIREYLGDEIWRHSKEEGSDIISGFVRQTNREENKREFTFINLLSRIDHINKLYKNYETAEDKINFMFIFKDYVENLIYDIEKKRRNNYFSNRYIGIVEGYMEIKKKEWRTERILPEGKKHFRNVLELLNGVHEWNNKYTSKEKLNLDIFAKLRSLLEQLTVEFFKLKVINKEKLLWK